MLLLLGRDAARNLASYFAMSSHSRPLVTTTAISRRGEETISMEGIPEANIVSCYACHGPNAEGVRDIPRLGGLAYFYLQGRLEQWGQEYHSGTESPMPMAASHLGPNEIEALASYLCQIELRGCASRLDHTTKPTPIRRCFITEVQARWDDDLLR
jgi:hypothetical protein